MRPKIKGWSSAKKAEIVLALLKGAKQLVDICREDDLKQSKVEKWKENFLSGGEQSLKINTVDKVEEEIKELGAKVGELTLEIDARKKLIALTFCCVRIMV